MIKVKGYMVFLIPAFYTIHEGLFGVLGFDVVPILVSIIAVIVGSSKRLSEIKIRDGSVSNRIIVDAFIGGIIVSIVSYGVYYKIPSYWFLMTVATVLAYMGNALLKKVKEAFLQVVGLIPWFAKNYAKKKFNLTEGKPEDEKDSYE